ncbi:MAG: beta-ketoacyl synthase N-terminal-like domain-containing protein, partial [Abditibacteriales bacterium]|nr:beta-ketoacyl synthase N-terminal-like domain-containing protein [Abditibacteriales bacterium]
MYKARVVITGLGAVTSIGLNVGEFWQSLLTGRSGAAEVTAFDTSAFRTHVACEVKGFDATATLGADTA